MSEAVLWQWVYDSVVSAEKLYSSQLQADSSMPPPSTRRPPSIWSHESRKGISAQGRGRILATCMCSVSGCRDSCRLSCRLVQAPHVSCWGPSLIETGSPSPPVHAALKSIPPPARTQAATTASSLGNRSFNKLAATCSLPLPRRYLITPRTHSVTQLSSQYIVVGL